MDIAEQVKARILSEIADVRKSRPAIADTPLTAPQRGALFGGLSDGSVKTDADRHAMLLYLVGHQSTTTMTQAEAIALIHWLQEWPRSAVHVVKAGHAILGQSEMKIEAA